MRIKLKEGKQKELIESVKKNYSWKELSKHLGLSQDYLRLHILKEKVLLSEENYNKLCQLSKENFGNFVMERLEDNWGQLKGAQTSSRNTKEFIEPEESLELAEIFGLILGDGNVNVFKKGRARCYILRIAGDNRDDKDYLSNYVSDLFLRVFKEKGRIMESEKFHGIYLSVYGKSLIEFLNKKGLPDGNKKENNQGIPKWIKANKEYLKACIRGLIDTDGSVHYISKNNKNLRISFTSYIPKLLQETRNAFIDLGFSPSKIISEKQIFLSSKSNISKYAKDVGFSNAKHLKRVEQLTKHMPL